MMKSRTLSQLLLAGAVLHPVLVLGEEKPAECGNEPAILMKGLHRAACRVVNSAVVEEYLGEKPSSPYATEFDQRKLIVAYGKKSTPVISAVEINYKNPPIPDDKNLLRPPAVDEISKIGSMKKKKLKIWSIWTRQVQYLSQGGRAGYVLLCSTAVGTFNNTIVGLSECLPFEMIDEFNEMLKSIRLIEKRRSERL